MKNIALIDGKIYDPLSNTLVQQNILIANGKVAGLGYVPDEKEDDLDIINLKGKVIIPNVTDLGPNLQEPGGEDRETIMSASEAAIRGGITTLVANPNTPRPVDSPEAVHFVKSRSEECDVDIVPMGAISKGCMGESLAEMSLMRDEGAVAFSDGLGLSNISLLKNAMMYAEMMNVTLILGAPKAFRESGAVMNQGPQSTVLGLKGGSDSIEIGFVESVLGLMKSVGAKIHFSSISSAKSLELIRAAKSTGLNVTCGVSVMHLVFCEDDLGEYDPLFKVDPPLRSQEDRSALLAGIADGTIDVVSSHHMPCTIDEKRIDFTDAEFGVSGLDLFVPSLISILHHDNCIPMERMAALISKGPQDVLGLNSKGLALGSSPSFTVIDSSVEWQISESDLVSHGKNTPLIGKTLKGRVNQVFVDGRRVYSV